MDLIRTTKFVVRNLAGAGASIIIHTIIKNNVEGDSLLSKTEVAAGSFVLGRLVSTAVRTYTDTAIDGIVEAWRNTPDQTEDLPKAEIVIIEQ